MKKIIYLIKQLLPLTYYSKYRDQNGSKELAIWTQWFGKPFNIKRYNFGISQSDRWNHYKSKKTYYLIFFSINYFY